MSAVPVIISDPIRYIKDRRDECYDRSEILCRDRLYEEAFSQCKNDIAALRFAKGFANFLAKKKILVNKYDILAGYPYRYNYSTTMPVTNPDDYDPRFRPITGLRMDEETANVEEFHHIAAGSPDAETITTFVDGMNTRLYKHWESGHIIPGYGRLLNKGFGGLIAEGEAALKKANGVHKDFIRAMLICCEASAQYILRYGKQAEELATQTENPAWKANLGRIAQACANVAYQPASSFFEALQLLWLSHELMYMENVPASFSLGRMDKYLYPFYQKDKEAGLITYEQAGELMDALWLNFGVTLHAYQNITIGGLDEKGDYVANDVTYMCLQSSRRLRFDQPLLSLRYHSSISQALWEESLALLETGIGMPAFFGDDMCIPAKMKMGLTKEDATEYGLIGCVEMAAPH